MKAYSGSQEEAVEAALESYPITAPLWEFAKQFDGDHPWVGTPTGLLTTLNDRIDDDALKRAKDWPKAPNKLTEQLNRLAPSLAEAGVHYLRLPSHTGGRKVQIFFEEKAVK